MSNKNPPSYPEIIKEIMEPLFEKNNYPILADYEEAVAEWMNDFYEFGENDSKRYKKRDFHSQVQKHVSAMLDKELVKYDDKYIIPNTIKHWRMCKEVDIKNHVKFAKKEVFELGSKIVGIMLDSKDEKEIKEFGNLIRDYIGKDELFSHYYANRVLYLFLLNEDPELVEALKRIVRETYEKCQEIEAQRKQKITFKKERQS